MVVPPKNRFMGIAELPAFIFYQADQPELSELNNIMRKDIKFQGIT